MFEIVNIEFREAAATAATTQSQNNIYILNLQHLQCEDGKKDFQFGKRCARNQQTFTNLHFPITKRISYGICAVFLCRSKYQNVIFAKVEVH